MFQIRNEKRTDYKTVEEITRKAFYNLYVPGCVEHYLVHIMREHEDFLPELDFVAELDGEVIGQFLSIAHASRALKISRRSLSCALSGAQKTAGGFVWEEQPVQPEGPEGTAGEPTE